MKKMKVLKDGISFWEGRRGDDRSGNAYYKRKIIVLKGKGTQKKWGSDGEYVCKYTRTDEEKVIVQNFQLHLRAALTPLSVVSIFLLGVWGFDYETGYLGPSWWKQFSFVKWPTSLCLSEAVNGYHLDKDTLKPIPRPLCIGSRK